MRFIGLFVVLVFAVSVCVNGDVDASNVTVPDGGPASNVTVPDGGAAAVNTSVPVGTTEEKPSFDCPVRLDWPPVPAPIWWPSSLFGAWSPAGTTREWFDYPVDTACECDARNAALTESQLNFLFRRCDKHDIMSEIRAVNGKLSRVVSFLRLDDEINSYWSACMLVPPALCIFTMWAALLYTLYGRAKVNVYALVFASAPMLAALSLVSVVSYLVAEWRWSGHGSGAARLQFEELLRVNLVCAVAGSVWVFYKKRLHDVEVDARVTLLKMDAVGASATAASSLAQTVAASVLGTPAKPETKVAEYQYGQAPTAQQSVPAASTSMVPPSAP